MHRSFLKQQYVLMFFLVRTVARYRVLIALTRVLTTVPVLRLVLELLALQIDVIKLRRAELGLVPQEDFTSWTIRIRVETSYATKYLLRHLATYLFSKS